MYKQIKIVLTIIIIIAITSSLIFMGLSEPKVISSNNNLVSISEKDNKTDLGPLMYQTFNISINNKNLEFAFSQLLSAGHNDSHNAIHCDTVNISQPGTTMGFTNSLFLLNSNINGIGIKIDSIKFINQTHNAEYNSSLSFRVHNCNKCFVGGDQVSMLYTYNKNPYTINGNLTYVPVVSFTLYKEYSIFYYSIGEYHATLTHFPIKIID